LCLVCAASSSAQLPSSSYDPSRCLESKHQRRDIHSNHWNLCSRRTIRSSVWLNCLL
jgi:hypothetical protein